MPLKVTADPQRFDEAIEDLRKRVPMTKAEWEELESRARQRAFTVAGVAQLDVLNDTKKSLVDALEHGQTLEEWKEEIGERLESEWQGSVANPAARLETIYRTNLRTAYSRGHAIQASHPAVQRYRPYKRFIATMDVDTTDVCREAHGTVLPADHPWWNDHTPPLHFNCRSTVETLSEEEALELGISESPTELPASEGFGAKPEVDPDPTLEKWAAEKLEHVDEQLAEIYRAKEEARVREENHARETARPEKEVHPRAEIPAPETPRPEEPEREPDAVPPVAVVMLPALAQIRSDDQAPRPAEDQSTAAIESHAEEDKAPPRGVASQLSHDLPSITIGEIPPDLVSSSRATTTAAQLSIQTLEKNRRHHPEVPESAYDEIEAIMQNADLVVAEPDGSLAFFRASDQMYLVVRPTMSGKAAFVRSLRKASPKEPERMLRRGKVVRMRVTAAGGTP